MNNKQMRKLNIFLGFFLFFSIICNIGLIVERCDLFTYNQYVKAYNNCYTFASIKNKMFILTSNLDCQLAPYSPDDTTPVTVWKRKGVEELLKLNDDLKDLK